MTDLSERFWSKVDDSDIEGCWPFIGCINSYGYGRFNLGGGKITNAHRVAYELSVGSVKGLEICHTCDNPPCCNPAHLFAGSHADNIRDMFSKGRNLNYKGAEHGMSKLTEEQIKEIRSTFGYGSGIMLARKFCVTDATIADIRKRKTWKHVL